MDRQRLKEVSDAFDEIKNLQLRWKTHRERGAPTREATQEFARRKAVAVGVIMEHLPEMVLELYEGSVPSTKRLDVWKTGDGRKINVKDLENDHLKNIIRFLRENSWTKRSDQLPIMLQEARNRGIYQ